MIFPSTQDMHVIVVGDLMLDRYWFGPIQRVSQEAPVPVINVAREEDSPGGARLLDGFRERLGERGGVSRVHDEVALQTENAGEANGDARAHARPAPAHYLGSTPTSGVFPEAEVKHATRRGCELGADAPGPARRGTEGVEQRVRDAASLGHRVR